MIELDGTSRVVTVERGMRLPHRMLAFIQMAGIALLMFAYADTARAELFGRWFFSPEERRILDDNREAGEVKRGPELGPETRTVVAPVVDVISFDGKVERSDGASTVWVNGKPVYTGNRTAEGIRVRPSRGTGGEARFVLPPSDAGTTEFSLKAGQKVAVQNGRKFDAYEVRPGEDAESVLGEKESEEPVENTETDDSSEEAGASGDASPSPGG